MKKLTLFIIAIVLFGFASNAICSDKKTKMKKEAIAIGLVK